MYKSGKRRRKMKKVERVFEFSKRRERRRFWRGAKKSQVKEVSINQNAPFCFFFTVMTSLASTVCII